MSPSEYNLTRYQALKGWLSGATAGKQGMARLNAMGVVWRRGALAEDIVEAVGKAESAPPLPPLGTFRDKASFLAGLCWGLAWLGARSRNT